MNETSSKSLESSKIAELVREYRSAGYEVIEHPQPSDLPKSLINLNYLPDLIARSEQENIIIEVKTRESIKHSSYLSTVSGIIRSTEGWQFLLVYTNPKKKRTPSAARPKQSIERIREALDLSHEQIGRAGSDFERIGVLLGLWSVLEALVALLLPKHISGSPRSPFGIIRDATIAGAMSKESFQFLDELLEKRNLAAHGNLSSRISQGELRRLWHICNDILKTVDTA